MILLLLDPQKNDNIMQLLSHQLHRFFVSRGFFFGEKKRYFLRMSETKYRVFVDYTGEVTNRKARPIEEDKDDDMLYVLMLENLPNDVSKEDVEKFFGTNVRVESMDKSGSFRVIFTSLKSFREALRKEIKIKGNKVRVNVCVRACRPVVVLDKETFLRKKRVKKTKAKKFPTSTKALMEKEIVRPSAVQSAFRPKPAVQRAPIPRPERFPVPSPSRALRYDDEVATEGRSYVKTLRDEVRDATVETKEALEEEEDMFEEEEEMLEEEEEEDKIEIISTETQFQHTRKERQEKKKEKDVKDDVIVTAAAPNENYRNETILLEAWLLLDEHLTQHVKELKARSYSDLKRGVLKNVERGKWIDILVELEDDSCDVHPKRDRLKWNGVRGVYALPDITKYSLTRIQVRTSSDHYIKIPRTFEGKEIRGCLRFQVCESDREKAVELRFRIPIRPGHRSIHRTESLTAQELSTIHAFLVNADFEMLGEDKWKLPAALESFIPFKERQKFKQIRNKLSELQTRALETHDTLKPHFDNAITSTVHTIRDEILTHLSLSEYKKLTMVERMGTDEFSKIYFHVWKFISERDDLDSYRDVVSMLRQKVSMTKKLSSGFQPHCDIVKLILDAKLAKARLFEICSRAFSEMSSSHSRKSKLIKAPVKRSFRICEKIAFMGLEGTLVRTVDMDDDSFAEISDRAQVLRSYESKEERMFDLRLHCNGLRIQVPESYLFPLVSSSPSPSSSSSEIHAKNVRDIARIMIVFSTMNEIASFARLLAKHPGVSIHRIKDRFCDQSPSGWRDLMINLSVEQSSESKEDLNVKSHVCEIQLVHSRMLHARKGLPGHEVYGKVRNALEMLELFRDAISKRSD